MRKWRKRQVTKPTRALWNCAHIEPQSFGGPASSVSFCSMYTMWFDFPCAKYFLCLFSFNLYKKSNVSAVDMSILRMRKISLVLMICLCSWFQIQIQTHLPAEPEPLGTNLPTLGQAPKGKLDFHGLCLFVCLLLCFCSMWLSSTNKSEQQSLARALSSKCGGCQPWF